MFRWFVRWRMRRTQQQYERWVERRKAAIRKEQENVRASSAGETPE